MLSVSGLRSPLSARAAAISLSTALLVVMVPRSSHAQDDDDVAPPAASSGQTSDSVPESDSAPESDSTPEGDSAPERALKLHDQARGLYTQGRYSDAVAKLKEAVRLDPKAIVLFYNLGLIEEKTGDLNAAQEHYEAALALVNDDRERNRLRSIIRRVQAAQSHGEGRGGAPATAPAEPAPADDAPKPPVRSPGFAPFAWGAAGLGAAGLVAGVALAMRADAVNPGADAMTSADVSVAQLEADADKAHELAIGADVAFAVAGAAAIAAIILGVIESTASGEQSAMRLEVGDEGLSWRF